jgi:hypothetical protein
MILFYSCKFLLSRSVLAILVIRVFAFCPAFAPATNITNPDSSNSVSSHANFYFSKSYSFPISTGLGLKPKDCM